MQLASRFHNASGIRADSPLSNDQIRNVAPSIFAEAAHESRSARYTYIPTIDVLNGLRKEGFQPRRAQRGKARVHQTHDSPAPRRPDQGQRSERNHFAEQPRRHEQLSDAGRDVPFRLSATTTHPGRFTR